MPDEPQELTLEGVKVDLLAALTKIKDDWKAHGDKLHELGADYGEHKAAVQKILDNSTRRIDEAEALLKNPSLVKVNAQGEVKSIGAHVADNERLRSLFGEGKASQWEGRLHIPLDNIDLDGSKGGCFFPEALAVARAWVPELKTTITSSAVGSGTSGVLMPQRMPGIVTPPQPRIRVRELIPRLPTTSNAIDWVKESSFSEVVSPQTEASAKGESEIQFTTDTESVRLIATWIPASRQILDDFVGLQAYLNVRLLDALANEEDDQILRGDGAGQNLSGFSNEATAYVDATYDETGDTVLDKLLRMQTQLHAGNYSPSGYVLHPTNWDIIRTIKANYGGGAGTGPYVLGGPGGMSPAFAANFIWGLPVATTTRMTAGQAFCGDFANYVVLWDRMMSRIDISTEHSDYFTKNLVAIRAEERLCLTIRDGGAIIYESSL
jgi:HK97 family phage major capsid protein